MADDPLLAEFRASLANAGGAGARTAEQLPDARLNARLTEARGEVWGRLAGAYVIADPPPALVRTILFGIAAYLATLEYFGSQPLEQRGPVQLAYDRARELLEKIARGSLVVEGVTSTTGAPATTSAEAAIYQGPPAVGLAAGFLGELYTGRHNTPAYTSWD